MALEDIIKAIFDINKIPTKIFLVVAIVGTFIFYNPYNLVLINFKENSDIKIYAYITYLICTGIFIINCITGIFNFIFSFFRKIQIRRKNKEILKNLDKYEIAVLREFYLYQKNTLSFPYEDPIIKGLVDKKVLLFSSQFGTSILLSGRNSTFKINSYLKELINIEKDLGITNNPTPTEQNFVLKNRPHWTTNDLRYIESEN